MAMIPLLEPRNLSNTAYGLVRANLGNAPPWTSLLEELANAAMPKVGKFNEQDLSNTAWAYATAKHPVPALFDAMANAAMPKVGEFKAQELSNTAWAYATAEHPAPALFDAIAEEVEQRERAGQVFPDPRLHSALELALGEERWKARRSARGASKKASSGKRRR